MVGIITKDVFKYNCNLKNGAILYANQFANNVRFMNSEFRKNFAKIVNESLTLYLQKSSIYFFTRRVEEFFIYHGIILISI